MPEDRSDARCDRLLSQARTALTSGRYRDATEAIDVAFTLLDFRRAEDRRRAAVARALLSEVRRELGNAAGSVCAAKRSAEGLLRHRGDPLLTARALTTVAIALWDSGSPVRALGYFEQADAAIGGTDVDVEEQINKRDNLGLCQFALGRHADSITTFRSALELAEAHELEEDIRSISRRLANAYQEDGSYELARQTLDKAAPPDTAGAVERAGWLNASAMLDERRGHLAAAEDQYDRAVALFPHLRAERHRMSAILSNAAMLKLELGRFAEADRLARHLQRLARGGRNASHAPLSTRLGFLRLKAMMAEYQGRLRRADALWQQAQQAVEADAAGNAQQRSKIGEQRFALLWRQNHKDQAVAVLSELISPFRSADDGRPLSNEQIGPAIRLAHAHVELDRAHQAAPLLRAAFAAEAGRADSEARWQLLAAMADLAAKFGQAEAAILLGKMAARVIAETARPAMVDWAERIPFLERRLEPLKRVTERLVAAGRIVEASAVIAQMKRQRLLTFTNRRGAAAAAGLSIPMRDWESHQEEAYRRCCADVTVLQAEADNVRASVRARNLAKTRLAQIDAATTYDDLLAFRTPRHASSLRVWPEHGFSNAAVGRGFARFIETDTGITLHMTAGGRCHEFAVSQDRAAVSRQVMQFRQAIDERSIEEGDLARSLYDVLLRPAAQVIDELSFLEVFTAGVLDYVPFACLQDERGHLVERLALQVRTAALGRHRLHDPTRRRSVVAFATTEEVAGMPALRHANAELAALEAAVPDVRIVRDAAFTRERLGDELVRGPTHILFACHFHLEPAASHRSCLILGDGQEVLLSELASSDFNGVELVILSGCDTATVETGDQGMQSLAGLVLDCGADAVIGSIWPVDDAQTARLMGRLFEELFSDEGLQPNEALRRAQLVAAHGQSPSSGVLRGGIGAPFPQRLPPFYWAGFSVYRHFTAE